MSSGLAQIMLFYVKPSKFQGFSLGIRGSRGPDLPSPFGRKFQFSFISDSASDRRKLDMYEQCGDVPQLWVCFLIGRTFAFKLRKTIKSENIVGPVKSV